MNPNIKGKNLNVLVLVVVHLDVGKGYAGRLLTSQGWAVLHFQNIIEAARYPTVSVGIERVKINIYQAVAAAVKLGLVQHFVFIAVQDAWLLVRGRV